MFLSSIALLILLVFHLVLLFRWRVVRRPGCFVIGAGAVLAGLLLAGIFGSVPRSWGMTVAGIVATVASVVALGSGIWACYGGPISLSDVERDIEHTVHETAQSSAMADSGKEA